MSEVKLIPEDIGDFLSYDPETGVLRWKVGRGKVKAGGIAGVIDSNGLGYRKVGFRGVNYYAHRIAWFLHYGEQPPEKLDHWGNEPSDNRIENLRSVSQKENTWNRSMNSNNTSGFKGVTFDKAAGKFRPRVQVGGKRPYLGLYDTPEEANRVARAFREKHKGEFTNHG